MDTGGRGQPGDRLQQQSAINLLKSPELLSLDPSAHPVDKSTSCPSAETSSWILSYFLPGPFLSRPAFFPGLSFPTDKDVQQTPVWGWAAVLGHDCIYLNKLTVDEGGWSGL